MFWVAWSIAMANPTDRIYAVVDEQVVLSSDLLLDEELKTHDISTLPFWFQGTAAERQLAGALIRSAAGDIGLYKPRDRDVQQRTARFLATFSDGGDAFVKRWGLSPNDLTALFQRRMIVEAYLLRNLSTSVDDPETFTFDTRVLIDTLRGRSRVRIIEVRQP